METFIKAGHLEYMREDMKKYLRTGANDSPEQVKEAHSKG